MDRLFEHELIRWKNNPSRLPLLVRGARQVGKTFTVTQFGLSQFKYFININFELYPQYKECFQSLEPTQILEKIHLYSRQAIIPGETLLFFDEIQECPQAIMSLRYFKEMMPELHVIGAGSLLEFAIKNEAFRMPVGRVQSLYLKPLSFREYLHANQYDEVLYQLQAVRLNKPLSPALANLCESLLREYFTIGGMPAVVSDYCTHKDIVQAQTLQISLLNTYRSDFGKYARTTQHKYLQQIFQKVPGMVGEKFQYASVDPDMRARELKQAIETLVDAGLIYPVRATKASGLPLNTRVNEKKFKLLFIDIGLVKATSLLSAETMLAEDLMLANQGMLVEQFVGQELLTLTPNYFAGELFYWVRDKRGSMAEIDYITNIDQKIIPIEVKAGRTGRLKSMRVFMNELNVDLGIRLSLKPLVYENGILSIPLYMIHELPRLVKEMG